MLQLKNAAPSERELLWNLIQKYMYEMTSIYNDPMDENGNYSYEYLDEYFTDPKRTAYFIFNDGVLIGFALLCPYSCLDLKVDHTMAEFTIFPAFRRNHFAVAAAKMILEKHKGKWEIKYNERNSGAKRLWNALTEPYKPQVFKLDDEETVLVFNNL